MNFGCPVVVNERTETKNGSQKKIYGYASLSRISVQEDDPNSFNEELLQGLIAASPNILPVRDYLPSTKVLFSLGREIPVDLGAKTGFIDNLLVTNDGYLVIVETKLNRNKEGRGGIREVIAQTFQYGAAVARISLSSLEVFIKAGNSPALMSGETIAECVSRLATQENHTSLLADEFERTLASHLRCGEMLMLIASDGVDFCVERVSDFLNEQGNSSPFKFGLVELKFYTNGAERFVIPRTVLKTREVSRNVVVVDIRPQMDVVATATVTEVSRTAAGLKAPKSRTVGAEKPTLDRSQLLDKVDRADVYLVTELLEQLKAFDLVESGTSSYLRLGFYDPEDESHFISLVFLSEKDIQLFLPKRIQTATDEKITTAFRQQGSKFGFYKLGMDGVPSVNSLCVKYAMLADSVHDFAAFINEYKGKFLEALTANEPE